MIRTRPIFAAGAVVLACGLPAGLFGADPVPPHITAAIGSLARDMAEKTRDPEMKPGEVLTFAEVKAGGVVVNLAPGDGYWTKLFSKAVGNQGHVYPLVPIRGARTYGAERAVLEKAAAAAGKPKPFDPMAVALAIQFVTDFKNVKSISESIDWWHGDVGIPEQADTVFTADAYHEFHNKVPGDTEVFMNPFNMTEINRAVYRAMNPGGVYVISDYAAAPGAGFSASETLKRSDPEAVKAELTGVGFEFAGSDNALANPADDHTKPADPANKPDRFILKFRKPRTAPATTRRPTGQVLATWKRNWIENTLASGNWTDDPHNFPNGLTYHADGTIQEQGGNPNSGIIWGTWYWDAEGHNCQYHESPGSEGFVVCHPVDSLEAMNAEPGGYSWAYLSGAEDARVSTRALLKGQLRAKPTAGRGGGAGRAGRAGRAGAAGGDAAQ